MLETLTGTVLAVCHDRGISIDAVAPILRSGGFPGCHLASKLGVTSVLPLQYKHTYEPSSSVHTCHRSPIGTHGLPADAGILLVDTNTVTGTIARRAAADIRAALPDCRIVFASVMLDVALKALPGIDLIVSAHRTNEGRTLSGHAARQVGVSNDVYVFPWEELDEQWEQIQAAQSSPTPAQGIHRDNVST